MTENIVSPIPSRLHSVAPDKCVSGADEIYDDNLRENQENINAEVNEKLSPEEKTTIDTDCSVILKDNDGKRYFINKSNFIEAIRDSIGDVIDAINKTSVSKIAVTDSNKDLGTTTVSNFGSILSGLTTGKRLGSCVQGPVASTAKQSITGWLRAAHITMPGYGGSGMRTTSGYGLFLISVSSCYWHGEPTPALFVLSVNDRHHSLTQLGKIPATSYTQCLQGVRVVQKSQFEVYFDIKVRTMPSNNKGSKYFTTIYPLSGLPSDVETIEYTDVTSEDVGTNVTVITLTP